MKVMLSANAAWNLTNFRGGLIRALQAEGHEVVAVAPADHGAEALAELARFVPIAIDNQGTSPARDAALTARYLGLIRREKPDVYCSYTIKPNVYGTLAARAAGVPAINNVSGLGTAFIRDTWITRVVKRLYRTAFRGSATVFFQNTDDRDLFLAERLVRPEQVRLVPGSGVDLQEFAATPMPEHEAPVFLLIARLLWDKGIAEYVEAARWLKAIVPEARCQLLGFLDVPNRTAVTRTDVDGWVAEGIVEYLGSTDDVRPFIADADCVVLPSYREGTPRTLLEAAAMARPLIATDVPGCREPLDDGINGFLCRVRDGRDLAARMEAFAAHSPEKRAMMGAASRRIAEARFDEKQVIGAYIKAIEHATQALVVMREAG